MISSNINEILIKKDFDEISKNDSKESFLDSIIEAKISNVNKELVRTKDFTYENIKGISLEEIDSIFESTEDKNMAKNLRLATLFTNDDYLGKAIFETIKGEPFNIGFNYLLERYEDKHSYFESLSNSNSSLSELLHNSLSKRVRKTEDDTVTDVIPKEYLNEILFEINSFDFVSALSRSSKDAYGRYKDKNDSDEYAFLYNDYNLKYEELKYKYDELKNYDNSLIKQF